jgi:hypothetical protein
MLTADQTGRASRVLADANLVSNTVDALAKAGSTVVCTADHSSQCDLLNAIVKADLEPGRPLATAPLVQQLCETKNINRLFAFALTTGVDESNRAEAACPALATLLRRTAAATLAQEGATPEELPSVVQVALTHVPDIVNTLRGYKKAKYFGCHRLQLVELVASISHSNFSHAHRVLVEQKAFSVLFDIFFERIWLNFVHRIVAEMVEALAERGAKSRRVIVHFLKHLSVHRRCAEAALVGAERAISVRSGAMGYVVRVANALVAITGQSTDVDEVLQAEPKWTVFIKTDLVERNDLDRTPLAARVAARNGGDGARSNQYGTMKFDPDGGPPPIPDSLPPPKPPRAAMHGMNTADPRQLQAAVAAMRNSGGVDAAIAASSSGVAAYATGRTMSELDELKAEEERIKAAFAEKQAEEARKKEKKRLKKSGSSDRDRDARKLEKKAKKDKKAKDERRRLPPRPPPRQRTATRRTRDAAAAAAEAALKRPRPKLKRSEKPTLKRKQRPTPTPSPRPTLKRKPKPTPRRKPKPKWMPKPKPMPRQKQRRRRRRRQHRRRW